MFIYTCPPSSKLREKMLYSCSRGGAIATAEAEAGVKVVKKVKCRFCLECIDGGSN